MGIYDPKMIPTTRWILIKCINYNVAQRLLTVINQNNIAEANFYVLNSWDPIDDFGDLYTSSAVCITTTQHPAKQLKKMYNILKNIYNIPKSIVAQISDLSANSEASYNVQPISYTNVQFLSQGEIEMLKGEESKQPVIDRQTINAQQQQDKHQLKECYDRLTLFNAQIENRSIGYVTVDEKGVSTHTPYAPMPKP